MTRALIILQILIMKKQILNLGKALNKAEQKEVNGGLVMPGDGDGTVGKGSLCVRVGAKYPHQKCIEGLTCKGEDTLGICG